MSDRSKLFLKKLLYGFFSLSLVGILSFAVLFICMWLV